MKTKLTYLLMIIMTMTMALGFTSCGDDDENEVITVSIVGTWTFESEKVSETYEFRSGLSGVHSVVNRDEYGEITTSAQENFEYSLSESNDGTKYVTIVFETTSRKYKYEVTASKLLLYTSATQYFMNIKGDNSGIQ